MAWSPDSARLAVASGAQESIKLWDVQNREELLTLAGPGGLLAHAAFSPDGNVLSALDGKGILHCWLAPSWDQIRAAEKQ